MSAICKLGVLVDLSIPSANAVRTDKRVTSETAEREQSKKAATRVVKMVYPLKRAEAIQKQLTALRTWHYARTMLWDDRGLRLLPAAQFEEYLSGFQDHCRAVDQEVQAQYHDWKVVLREIQSQQGNMFDANMVPSQSATFARLRPKMNTLPIPSDSHFTVNLEAALMDQIKTSLREEMNSRVNAAMLDLWDRAEEELKHVFERLDDPEKIFKDSLIHNVSDYCKTGGKLNIFAEPIFTKFLSDMFEAVCRNSPDTLRKNKNARRMVADKVKDLLKETPKLRTDSLKAISAL